MGNSMVLRYPAYYEQFTCIANRCEDTCCAGWEIDIDDKSYQFYMGVGGGMGERLRANIKEYGREDGDVYEQHGFILREGRRCPFLDEKGLCELYRELGEGALCSVCTDTPRNYLEYGGERELAISAGCPEAGRLIYMRPEKITFVERDIDDTLDWEESDDEIQFARQIRLARDRAIRILQNRTLPIEERIVRYLSYAEEVQGYLNGNAADGIADMGWEKYLQGVSEMGNNDKMIGEVSRGSEMAGDVNGVRECYKLFLRRLVSYTGMESISKEWDEMLELLRSSFVEPSDGAQRYAAAVHELEREMAGQQREYEYEHLMVYYVFLCQARCVDDYDFVGKAKLAVASYLMVRDMDAARLSTRRHYEKADRVDIARIYAREVEHSDKNLQYLADEFLFEGMYDVRNLSRAVFAPISTTHVGGGSLSK